MEIKTFFAQDQLGNTIANPTVTIYTAGTTNLAAGIKDATGNVLSNPFSGTENGQIQFSAPNGDYDMRVSSTMRSFTMRVRFVDIYEQAQVAINAANNASAAVVSQLQAIKSQTETARDQALAGLGAADNSQVLSELLGTIAYALNLIGAVSPKTFADSIAPEQLALNHRYLLDMIGVTARAIAGGDALLGPGLVSAPSLAAFGDRNTGIYFPASDQLAIATGGIQRLLIDASGNHATGTDNAQSLGTASKRWSTVYAGTGTINTSDAREKTAVTPLSAAELAAASAMSKEIGSYQFLASIADKGDAARHHIGLTVQRAIEIMEANDLDPFKFGFICHDSWPEIVIEHPATEAVDDELDEEGNVVRPGTPAKDATTEIVQAAGDRYAFRYDQLALFIAAGFEARLSALETA